METDQSNGGARSMSIVNDIDADTMLYAAGKRKTSMDHEGSDEEMAPIQIEDLNNEDDSKRGFGYKIRRRKNVIAEIAPDDEEAWTKTVPKNDKTRGFLMDSLKNCFLFESLSKTSLDEIVDVMKEERVQGGSVLFREGDPGKYFYFVEIGSLKVFKKKTEAYLEVRKSITFSPPSPLSAKTSPSNSISSPPSSPKLTIQKNRSEWDEEDQVDVRTYSPGEWFGELSLLYESKRNASVVAETDAVLWKLDRVTFKKTCQSNWESNFETTIKALRSVPLLRPLTEDQIKDVAQVVRIEEFSAGQTIIEAGSLGSTFYIVKSGRASVFVPGETEAQAFYQADDFFGELSLLQDQPRAATIKAVTDVTVICIDKNSFTNILGPIKQVIDDNIRAFVLQEINIFRELSTDKRVEVFKLFKEVSFKKGNVIIREGEKGDSFYIIRAGCANVVKQMPDAVGMSNHQVGALGVGDYFGEMGLLFDDLRKASVIAAEDCDCFMLTRESFGELAGEGDLKERLIQVAKARERDNQHRALELEKKRREGEIKQLLERVNNNAVVTPFRPDQMQQPQMSHMPSTSAGYYGNFHQFHAHQQQQSFNFHPFAAPKQTNYHLDQFKSICTLGTGTFGRVKLVIHAETKVAYALKIQSKHQIMKFNLRSNIFNEKDVLLRMNHPFIVTLHQTFQDGDYLYMLLELVQGGELFSLLQNLGPKLQMPHHVFYVSCVVSAFEALHAFDILYRDLKPENLMIDGLGYLKLVDFGFAKIVERRTFTLCGTPEYFSPELVLGKGYGKGNDIWALGILAYELISGYTPFGNNDDPQSEIYKKIVRDDLYFPRDCYDQKGMHLISRLLDKNAATRLGCDRMGISSIKRHPWFMDLDWNKLLAQKIIAPWKPKLKNAIDTSNFDTYDERYKLLPFRCDPNKDPFLGF